MCWHVMFLSAALCYTVNWLEQTGKRSESCVALRVMLC